MSGLSEGETHVAAMRLVCQSLEDHEQQGIEIQWDVLQYMLDHMDVILQGIAEQRRGDAEEIQILTKECHAAHEQVSTVRDEVAAEILTLRKQLGAARAETVEVRRRLAEEINRHNATHCEKIELFPKVEWANQHNAELIGERDAALATVDLQRAGIELLNAFVGKVRSVMDRQYDGVEFDDLSRALAELDAGTSEPEGEK